MKICVSLIGKNKEEILEEAAAVKAAGCHLAEWRADCFAESADMSQTQSEGLAALLGGIKDVLQDIPLIFTFRTQSEGGTTPLSKKEYIEMNLAAAKSGRADIIDIELFDLDKKEEEFVNEAELLRLIDDIHAAGAQVLFSNHDFKSTPCEDEMIRRLLQMRRLGGDIVKIAVMPHCPEDAERLLNVAGKIKPRLEDASLIAISMGELGRESRLRGSDITFAALKEGSAPGQIPIAELKRIIEERS